MLTRSEELRDRTKAFAIRVVKLYRSLPHTAESQVVGSSYCVAARRWQRTIAQCAEADLGPNGLPRLDWSSRRRTKLSFGWRCYPIAALCQASAAKIS